MHAELSIYVLCYLPQVIYLLFAYPTERFLVQPSLLLLLVVVVHLLYSFNNQAVPAYWNILCGVHFEVICQTYCKDLYSEPEFIIPVSYIVIHLIYLYVCFGDALYLKNWQKQKSFQA